MNDGMMTIYSAVDSNYEESIPKTAQKAYLNCKFWKATKEGAIKFSHVYRGPVRFDAFRTIALLNNGILNQKNIQSLNHNTAWLLISHYDLSNNTGFILAILHLNIFHCIDKLWRDIHNDKSYPHEYLIDDLLPWAVSNNLIDKKNRARLEKEIIATRDGVFTKKNVDDRLRIHTVQMLIKTHGYIFYSDAIELLLLKENILPTLEIAINTGVIIACFSKDKKNFYLHMESLLKWLMTHNHFPHQWLQDFKKLKVKSLEELASPTPQTFTIDQLKNFLKKYYPKNEDVNYHLNTCVYHAYLYIRGDAPCSYLENREPIQVNNHTYSIRYLNLERLLSFSTDPYHIAKNLLDGLTINANQHRSFIFLDSTSEEYSHGLQRILSLRNDERSENHYQLNYQDLRFIVDEVKQGLKKNIPLTSGKSRQKIATESGVISGKVRHEETQKHWLLIRHQVLDIAKSYNKVYINKIAEIAKKRGITTKSIRTISRLIAADPSFTPYLKKNSLLID